MGRLGRPHGLSGFLGFYLEEEHLERVQPGATVLVGSEPLVVRELRRVPPGYRIAFEGITERSSAEARRGLEVYTEGRFRLGDDEYWPDQLEGLTVVDETGAPLGTVTGVVLGAAQDRLVVTAWDGVVFDVPFVAALVPEVDVAGGVVRIVHLPGLNGR